MSSRPAKRGGIVVTRGHHSGLVEHRDLAHNHALSFSKQPYLRDLFKEVLDRRRPLTLVVGAGVSINASLPSWPKLIDRIIDRIDDDDLKELARGFQADPLRRAEFVLQLARRKNVSAEEHELIRDALYPKEYIARPGQLARAATVLSASPFQRLGALPLAPAPSRAQCQHAPSRVSARKPQTGLAPPARRAPPGQQCGLPPGSSRDRH